MTTTLFSATNPFRHTYIVTPYNNCRTTSIKLYKPFLYNVRIYIICSYIYKSIDSVYKTSLCTFATIQSGNMIHYVQLSDLAAAFALL